MSALSNMKHERFARLYMRTGNASLSYRLAGYSDNINAAWSNSYRLMGNDGVKRRIHELRRFAGRHSAVSLGKLIAELDESRDKARELEQPAVMVSATMNKAKLAGLLVEKREIGAPGGFSRAEVLDRIAERFGPETAELLIKMLDGYNNTSEKQHDINE